MKKLTIVENQQLTNWLDTNRESIQGKTSLSILRRYKKETGAAITSASSINYRMRALGIPTRKNTPRPPRDTGPNNLEALALAVVELEKRVAAVEGRFL